MDERLIQAARTGNRTALAALLREFQEPWFRFSMSLLGDADLAQDATQETGLRFLKLLPTFRGESQLRTWSLGIALNVTREMRRRHRSTVDITREGLSLRSLDPARGGLAAPRPPADAAELTEQREHLQNALAGLSDRQREAIVLRFFEELSVEQTAKAMSCAEGTVKATVHQALRAMRELLPVSWATVPRGRGTPDL